MAEPAWQSPPPPPDDVPAAALGVCREIVGTPTTMAPEVAQGTLTLPLTLTPALTLTLTLELTPTPTPTLALTRKPQPQPGGAGRVARPVCGGRVVAWRVPARVACAARAR